MINFDGKRSATNFDPTISDFYPESVKVAVQNVLSRDPNMPAVITSDILSLYAPGVTVDTSLVQKQVLDYYMPVYAYLYELYHSKRDTLLNKNDICLSSSLEDKLTRSSEARPEGMLSSSKVTSPPVFIGISAPQGCGKTTLTNTLIKLFARNNLRAIAISLDDFYLRGADQEVLASGELLDLLKLRHLNYVYNIIHVLTNIFFYFFFVCLLFHQNIARILCYN